MDELPVSDVIKALIRDGTEGDRSNAVYRAVRAMDRAGVSREQMLGVLTDAEYGISQRFLEREDPEEAARKDIDRIIGKAKAEVAAEFADDPETDHLPDVADTAKPDKAKPEKPYFLTFADLEKEEPLQYLLDRIIPENSLFELYGKMKPGVGGQATGPAVVRVGLALPPIHRVDGRLQLLGRGRPGAARPTACRCPALRSTTPLSWGRRGGFHTTSTPSPKSHSASSVGRSPAEPQGVPLSTRIRAGIPQRANASRSCPWVSAAGTVFQRPRGENRGPQDRPGELVDDPQPAGPGGAGQPHRSAASTCQVS